MEKGAFIVIEGIDGSGKTTLAKNLAWKIRHELRAEVFETAEPDKSALYRLIRESLAGTKMDNLSLQILFCLDRAIHVEKVINPKLEDGTWVVCDRYHLSTVAYGASTGLSLEGLLAMGNLFRRPDMTLFVDISPEAALERINSRHDKERFDTLQHQKKIADAYRTAIALSKGVYEIDGTGSVEKVCEDAWTGVQTVLKGKGFIPERRHT
jgi:dTMP kinase